MVNHKIEATAIKEALDRARRVLVVSHKRPDADTLGASCAWINLLTQKNKLVSGFCIDPVPDHLRHIPGSHLISTDRSIFTDTIDVIIVNDAGDLEYAGLSEIVPSRDHTEATLINIDHHTTNPHFGDINLVIDSASSTTEILSRLFQHWNEELTREIAECLLHGIITDTESMTNPGTNYQSLAIASRLVDAGADLHKIVQRTLYRKSLGDLKLWGTILSRLKRNDRYGVIMSYVLPEDVSQVASDGQSVEGIANYLTLIPQTNAILFLQQLDHETIKGSMRTVKDTVDVGSLAQTLGGGGHRKASGFRLKGYLQTRGNDWTII